jgi:hypothetical protein
MVSGIEGRRRPALRLDVHIDQARRQLLAVAGQGGRDVGLVGLLVLGEPHVAVDAEHALLGIARQRQVARREGAVQGVDQGAQGGLQTLVIDDAVGGEPVAVVVGGQARQEGQVGGGEAVERTCESWREARPEDRRLSLLTPPVSNRAGGT